MNNSSKNPRYADLPPAAYVLNLLGISILLFGIVVAYLVTDSQFKRRPLPEEQALQLQLEETSSINWCQTWVTYTRGFQTYFYGPNTGSKSLKTTDLCYKASNSSQLQLFFVVKTIVIVVIL